MPYGRRPPTRPLVLHVIPFLWSGAGSVLTRLCEAQRRHGPVALVTTGSRGERPDWPSYRARLRRAGVTHHAIDFFHRADGQFWTSATQLADLIRELKPAVIHAHAGVPACGAVVARAMSGHRSRLIGQMYSWGPNRPEWMNRQDMWGLAQTDRVVCSARDYQELLLRYGVPARKLVYLPWGLPLDQLPWRGDAQTPRRQAGSGRPARGPLVGFVGRIEPRKGQLDLVHAVARVRDTHPDTRLELIGPIADEAYATRIREAIRTHGLEQAVTLTGKVRDVAPRVSRWDLFVSVSSDEGQGLAVLEAMALGVAVIARPVAGISDFLTDGRTGVAIANPSIRSVADTILRTWSNAATTPRMRAHARRLVERRYDWARTIDAFERLYWGSR